MGFIDKNLMDGEEIIYRTKLHWIIFKAVAVVFLLSIWFFSQGDEVSFSFGVLLLLAVIVGAGITFLKYKTAEFGVSNKRVLIKVGIIRRDSLETLLSKVESIQVNQGILGRILGYGSIIVHGTGATKAPYKNISNALEFRKIVQEQIEKMERNK